MSSYKEAVWNKLRGYSEDDISSRNIEGNDNITINISSMRHPELFIKCAKEYIDQIPYGWNHWLFSDDYSELKKVDDYKLWE